MAELTPIPTEQRRAYYDALLAGRAEAERLGYGLMDDRIFAAFHSALYRPMLDAHEAEVRAKVAEEIAVAIEEAQDEDDAYWDAHPEFASRQDVLKFDGNNAARIARQHAAAPAVTAVSASEPAVGGAGKDDSHEDAQQPQKPCGCVGECPTLFQPCPVCAAEVRAVGVDNALAVTYHPCGHVVADDGSTR